MGPVASPVGMPHRSWGQRGAGVNPPRAAATNPSAEAGGGPIQTPPDGRMTAARMRRGKSGLHGDTVPGNARRGRPQGKCHREQTARPAGRARVKGCGKSAPRPRQRGRHGKPHREQDRIGAARDRATGPGRRVRVAARVGRARRPATDVPEEWSSRDPIGGSGRRGGSRTEPGLQAVWRPHRPSRPGADGTAWENPLFPRSGRSPTRLPTQATPSGDSIRPRLAAILGDESAASRQQERPEIHFRHRNKTSTNLRYHLREIDGLARRADDRSEIERNKANPRPNAAQFL